jgi:hypothetical protein
MNDIAAQSIANIFINDLGLDKAVVVLKVWAEKHPLSLYALAYELALAQQKTVNEIKEA